jgi:hypothetical protein
MRTPRARPQRVVYAATQVGGASIAMRPRALMAARGRTAVHAGLCDHARRRPLPPTLGIH